MGIEHRWDLAVAALVFAALLDGIDGRVARLLKAPSRFGAELDSLADFVNFGVAPAIIVFNWALDDLHSLAGSRSSSSPCARRFGSRASTCRSTPPTRRRGRATISSAFRRRRRRSFCSCPSMSRISSCVPGLTPLVLIYTLAVALLMVSSVPTFSGKLIGQKIPREYVPPVFVLAAAFMAVLLTYPAATLAVGSVIYLAVIPLSAYRYRAEERKAAKAAKAQSPKGTRPKRRLHGRGPSRSPENQAVKQHLLHLSSPARGHEGVLSGQAAVPAAACRYDLEVPRDDRLPRREASELGVDLIVHTNQERACATASPDHPRQRAPHRHHEDRGASSRRSTTTASTRPSAGARATRRSRAPRSASSRSARCAASLGPEAPAAGAVASLQHPHATRREHPRVPAVELDRARRLALHLSRGHPGGAALFRQADVRWSSATAC